MVSTTYISAGSTQLELILAGWIMLATGAVSAWVEPVPRRLLAGLAGVMLAEVQLAVKSIYACWLVLIHLFLRTLRNPKKVASVQSRKL